MLGMEFAQAFTNLNSKSTCASCIFVKLEVQQLMVPGACAAHNLSSFCICEQCYRGVSFFCVKCDYLL